MLRYLTAAALVWVTGMTLLQAIGKEPEFALQTYTYKTVGDCPIQADVHRAKDDVVRPVVVWIHGGALITGSTFLTAEEVYRRSRSQRAFFETNPYAAAARLAAIAELFEQADIRWIVADADHPAPLEIARDWPLVYSNATVRIYSRPITNAAPMNLADR